MRYTLRCLLPLLAVSLTLALGASPAQAQCPDFDGDGTPDGSDCDGSGDIPNVSPPTPIGPPEPPPPQAPPEPPPEPPSAELPPPEAPSPLEPTPELDASPPSSFTPSGGGGGGGSPVDPAIAAQRAVEAMEARAAWERASTNLRALAERGRALEAERLAFRRLLDDARRRSGRVAEQLARVPVAGAAATTPEGAWRGSPPPARGRRLAGPPPPPLGEGAFVTAGGAWPEPAPIAGLFDPQELLRAARDRILDKTKEWLGEKARDVIERNVPGARRLREMVETLQQYAQIGQDLSAQNEATLEGVFRAAGEVQRCMAGRPCDAASVDVLAGERGDAHRTTARDWVRELTRAGDEGDDDDDDDGEAGAP